MVKGTHREKDRNISVTPENTATRHFYYGRIRLEAGAAPLAFETATHETGLVCLNGAARVSVGESVFNLNRCDSLYVPRDSRLEAATETGCDLAGLKINILCSLFRFKKSAKIRRFILPPERRRPNAI